MGARRNGRGGRFRDSAASLPDIRALKTKYVGPSFAEGVHEGRYDPDHVEAAVSAALVRRPPGSSTSYAVHVSVHRVPDTSADFTIRVVDSNVLERLGVAEDQATTARSIFDEKPGPHKAGFLAAPQSLYHFPVLGFDDQEVAALADDEPRTGGTHLAVTFYDAFGRTLVVSTLPLENLAANLRLRLSPPESDPPDLPSFQDVSRSVTPMIPPVGTSPCTPYPNFLGHYISPNRPTVFDISTYNTLRRDHQRPPARRAAFQRQVEQYPGLYVVSENVPTHYHLQMGYE